MKPQWKKLEEGTRAWADEKAWYILLRDVGESHLQMTTTCLPPGMLITPVGMDGYEFALGPIPSCPELGLPHPTDDLELPDGWKIYLDEKELFYGLHTLTVSRTDPRKRIGIMAETRDECIKFLNRALKEEE